MLKQRLIVSLSLLPLFIAIVWFGQPWFTLLIAGWGSIAAYEFYTLVKNIKVLPLTYFGLLWVLLFIISPYFNSDFTIPILLTTAVIFPLFFLLARRNKEQAFNAWVWTLAGIIYIGWLLSYFISFSAFGKAPSIFGPLDARNWVFLGFLVTFASDTAAYFIGRKWGKHHMAPNVSPKKTWEGAVAGVIGAIVISLFFTLPTPLQLPPDYFNYWQAIALGIAISIFGQLGDLMKSLFKRNMSVKNSSNLIPGHGGFLDRMDSIAFAGLVLYYYLVWVNLIPLR